MIVSCKECQKRYLIDEELIGPQGRSVRCAACGNAWVQFPQESDFQQANMDSDPFQQESVKSRAFANFLLALLILTLLGAGIYWARHSLVTTWPAAGKAFEKLGLLSEDPAKGLEFENIVPLQTKDQKQAFLVLKGEIVNTTHQVRQLSTLKVLIHGNCAELGVFKRLITKLRYKAAPGRCVVDQWQHALTQSRLLPGERLSFETAPHPLQNSASEVAIEF